MFILQLKWPHGVGLTSLSDHLTDGWNGMVVATELTVLSIFLSRLVYQLEKDTKYFSLSQLNQNKNTFYTKKNILNLEAGLCYTLLNRTEGTSLFCQSAHLLGRHCSLLPIHLKASAGFVAALKQRSLRPHRTEYIPRISVRLDKFWPFASIIAVTTREIRNCVPSLKQVNTYLVSLVQFQFNMIRHASL